MLKALPVIIDLQFFNVTTIILLCQHPNDMRHVALGLRHEH